MGIIKQMQLEEMDREEAERILRARAELALEYGKADASLENELRRLLNQHSAENGSHTPDYILARYLIDCLAAYNRAVDARSRWYSPDEE